MGLYSYTNVDCQEEKKTKKTKQTPPERYNQKGNDSEHDIAIWLNPIIAPTTRDPLKLQYHLPVGDPSSTSPV